MARTPVISWATCGLCCSVRRRLSAAFPLKSSRRRRRRSGGARRSRSECRTALSGQKNASARRWWSGRGRLRQHPSGTGRPRSPKNDQTTASRSRSQLRRSQSGCLSKRSPSLRRGKSQWRPPPRPKKKLLRPRWKPPGRRPWRSTGQRARHADSVHHHPRSGDTGRVHPRGGHAAHAGGGPPHTTRRAMYRTTAGAPNLGVTGGVARPPGPVPVPPRRLLRATARAKRPSQTSSKRCLPCRPHCWRS